ncbi:TonB-dependent receptor [Rhizomicrobium electricum]|jgi:TonB-dependent receptor|uniref:TonB-dependent receptor n=1 Tax=Rhizomicrobium electricum TaxID=480070 RepID=A0ABN1F3T4_9PROT|nr:TonB-dependent receptor [Rhizomicrobium electricum]NIJ49330.1 TonB-dependent receptor [Rhizomicrobium electricum]
MAAKLKSRLYCSAAVALFACVGSAQAQEMETVVVTGQRAAIESAIAIKQKAEVIVDSVSAEDVGKLPDNSITEVLQRVPGVNITKLQVGGSSENYLGEGTNISIRGLTSTVSLLNGRDSFSAANGRNLAWEDIPPELAQGIDVYKSLSATLPEGGFGGVVNLRTRQPFDFDGLTASVTLTGNYADWSHKGHLGGVGMISDRWQTKIGEIGLLLNVAYSDLSTKADGVQILPYFPAVYNPTYTASHNATLPSLSDAGSTEVYVPNGFGFNRRVDDRTRIGLYAAAQWRPNETLLIGLTAFQSRYTMNDAFHGLFLGSGTQAVLGPNSTNTFDSDGNLTYTSGLADFMYGTTAAGITNPNAWAYQPIPYNNTTTYQHDVNTTTDIALTADWHPNDKFSANVALQYVDSSAKSDYNSAGFYEFINGLGLQLTSYGDESLPKVIQAETMADLSNPAYYGWLETMPHRLHNYGREAAIYIDTVYNVSDTGFLRQIRSGLKLTYRNERDKETNWNYKQLAPYWGSTYHYASDDPKKATLVDLSDLFNGDVGIPKAFWFPSFDAIKDPVALQNAYGTSGYTSDQILANLNNDTLAKLSESTFTAYAMATFAKDDFFIPISGNIGFRVVTYRDHASGYRWTPLLEAVSIENIVDGSGNWLAPKLNAPMQRTTVSGGRTQTDVLPSVNLQAQITPELKARFAFSQAVNRPTFAQMNPRGFVSGTYVGTYDAYFNGNWGNPNLKPEKAEQLDVSLEYYFASGGMVHVSGFWKQIHNMISTTQQAEPTTFSASWAGLTNPTLWQPGDPTAATLCTGAAAAMTCTVTASITEYFNEKQMARIDGFEIGLQKYASFLPDPFDGLGLDFNYTYIDSQQPGALAYDMKGAPISGLPVTGLSKNTINIAGMYDKGPLSLRVAYNWRSDFLASTAAWQTSGTYNYINNINFGGNTVGKVTTFALPVYQYAVGTLDANVTYNLTDNVSWTLEASNLTRSVTRLYMMEGYTSSGKERLFNRSWYLADTRYTSQIRVKF